MKREAKLIILALVLIVIAAGLFVRYFSASSSGTRPGATAADIEKQIADIQNNPHMPPQAKAIAINQIRSHAAGMSQPLAPGTK
ncbi:MAG: hypothetical protein ACP5VE_09015 [Chthonomonadales bacterium]